MKRVGEHRRLAGAVGLALLLGVLLVSGVASAQQRFPRPEFDSDYEPPSTTQPPPESSLRDAIDVAVLGGLLALATVLAVYKRSRRGLVWLSLVSVVYLGFIRQGCLCAIGSIQNVTLALADRGYVVSLTTIVLFLLPLVVALFFGRTFCGGVCPFGAMQDLVLLRPLRVPQWLADPLALLAYLYLGMAVLYAAVGSRFIICEYDPFVAFFRMSGSAGMLVLSVAVLLLAVVVARPYCRFVCPYGVLLSWMASFAGKSVTVNPDYCAQCRLCEDACPMGAIHRPTPERAPESRRRGIRRLATLMLLLPAVALAAGFVVSHLGTVLSRADTTVAMAERVQAEDAGLVTGTTLESRTFRASGEETADLLARARAVQLRFRRLGWLVGGFLGLVVMLKLLRLSMWRSRGEYRTHPPDCLSCGRCFTYCPAEHLQLTAQRGETDGT